MTPKDFSEAARGIFRRPLVVAGLGIVSVVGITWMFSSVAWWLGAPEREKTAKDKKLIEFCRSVYESISPQDKLCDPYHSFLTKEIQDEKNRTMREKQEAEQIAAAERKAFTPGVRGRRADEVCNSFSKECQQWTMLARKCEENIRQREAGSMSSLIPYCDQMEVYRERVTGIPLSTSPGAYAF